MDNYLQDLFIDEAKAALDSRGSGGGGGKLYRHKIRLQTSYFEYDGSEYYAQLDIVAYRSRPDAFTDVNDLDDSILDEVRSTSHVYIDGEQMLVSFVSINRISMSGDAFLIRTFYDADPTDGYWLMPKSEFTITDSVMEV